MHFQVPHKSTQVGAATKVRLALQQARPMAAQHQVTIDEERWEGYTLNFTVTLQGKKITGTVEVSDKNFIIDAKLPLLWRLFEGKIERAIAEQVRMLQ